MKKKKGETDWFDLVPCYQATYFLLFEIYANCPEIFK